jgi:predicted AAA+ superfamily ATPase
LGDNEVAIEVKSTNMVTPRHFKGLKSFKEEYKVKKLIVISNDPSPRQIDDIIVLPWRIFLEQLWAGEIISS